MVLRSFATRFRPSLAERCGVVSSCELNTSLPWCVHTSSIKLVFYKYSKRSLFRYRMERTDIEVASHRVDMCSCR